MKKMCIYHANCADGFTSAWAMYRRCPDTKFYAATYGEVPPDVSGYHVFMLDFMYPIEDLKIIAEQAASVLILDHHKSAIEAFTDAEGGNEWSIMQFKSGHHTLDTWADNCAATWEKCVSFLKDIDMSGAGLAWQFFHPDESMPALVEFVQDRDLWKFELEDTRAFSAALFSLEYTFDNWDRAASFGEDQLRVFIENGEAIERKHRKDVNELLSVCARVMEIGGYYVPAASLPYTMVSDAAGSMAKENPLTFAACYWDTATGRVFGLRSVKGGLDVSGIAKKYGGGGHKHSAGFTVPRDHPLAQA